MLQFLKNNKLVVIGVIIALIVAVAWWLFFRKPKDQDQDKESKNSGTGTNTSGGGSGSGGGASSGAGESTNTPKNVFPLKVGSKGREVIALQKFLNAADSSYKLKADGNFGALTQAAVQNEIPGRASTVSQEYYNDFVKKFEEKAPLRS